MSQVCLRTPPSFSGSGTLSRLDLSLEKRQQQANPVQGDSDKKVDILILLWVELPGNTPPLYLYTFGDLTPKRVIYFGDKKKLFR